VATTHGGRHATCGGCRRWRREHRGGDIETVEIGNKIAVHSPPRSRKLETPTGERPTEPLVVRQTRSPRPEANVSGCRREATTSPSRPAPRNGSAFCRMGTRIPVPEIARSSIRLALSDRYLALLEIDISPNRVEYLLPSDFPRGIVRPLREIALSYTASITRQSVGSRPRRGDETLVEIARSYAVSHMTISRLKERHAAS
jgi:hypothetical protein